MSGPWADRFAAWVDYDATLQPITVRAPLGRAGAALGLEPAGNPVATTASTRTARVAFAASTEEAANAAAAWCDRIRLAAVAWPASGSPLAAPRVGVLGLTSMPAPAGANVSVQTLVQAVALTLTARPCLAGTGIREVLRLASPLTTQVRLPSPVTTVVRAFSPVEIEQT